MFFSIGSSLKIVKPESSIPRHPMSRSSVCKNSEIVVEPSNPTTWYVPFSICTGTAWGSEWWWGFFSRIDKTSILEGFAVLAPFTTHFSRAFAQYEAYFPLSVLKNHKIEFNPTGLWGFILRILVPVEMCP